MNKKAFETKYLLEILRIVPLLYWAHTGHYLEDLKTK